MKVFISWSGNKSHKVAMIFRDWLPSVIQSLEPYVSSEDIDKGARWSTDIAKELEDSTFGILCVTKENLEAPWLSFEAGALSKTMDKSFVSPFLFDIKRSEVQGPILQFQSTTFQKDDIKKLITTLNKACGDSTIPDARLGKAFDVWYPTLEDELNKVKISQESSESSPPLTDESEILEEILELSRDNQKLLRNPDSKMSEEIAVLKQAVDNIAARTGRTIESKRTAYKYQSMFLDDIMHMSFREKYPTYGFLIALSLVREDAPWVYDIGKELLDILKSKSSKEEKHAALNAFKEMLDYSCNHPAMDENMNRKSNRIIMKELPYILSRYLDEFAL